MQTAEVIQIFQLLATVLVAAAAASIAWRQSETARAKLRLDLFERRFRVYRGVMDLLGEVARDGDVSREALGKYYQATDEKRFLFGDDVIAYLRELRDRAFQLHILREQINGLRDEPSREAARSKAINQSADELKWLTDQIDCAQVRFLKYLDFKKNL